VCFASGRGRANSLQLDLWELGVRLNLLELADIKFIRNRLAPNDVTLYWFDLQLYSRDAAPFNFAIYATGVILARNILDTRDIAFVEQTISRQQIVKIGDVFDSSNVDWVIRHRGQEKPLDLVYHRFVCRIRQIKVEQHSGFDVLVQSRDRKICAPYHQSRALSSTRQVQLRMEDYCARACIDDIELADDAVESNKPLIGCGVVPNAYEHSRACSMLNEWCFNHFHATFIGEGDTYHHPLNVGQVKKPPQRFTYNDPVIFLPRSGAAAPAGFSVEQGTFQAHPVEPETRGVDGELRGIVVDAEADIANVGALTCKFCQNWDISKVRALDQVQDLASPEEIAEAAVRSGCRTNSRSVALSELDATPSGETLPRTIVSNLAPGQKISVMLATIKSCVFNLHGAYAHGHRFDKRRFVQG
jgi:hypothetical protein